MKKKCEVCENVFEYDSADSEIICTSCGFNFTTDDDEGADLFPNGRDYDAEDDD